MSFMSWPAGSVPATAEPGDRLASWKEIAAYLNRGVTTVQRWEREEGLPVYRHQHDSLGSVFAYKHELEAWRLQRAVQTDADEPSTLSGGRATTPRNSSRVHPALVLGALCVAAGIGAIGQRLATREPPKPVRRLTIVSSGASQLASTGTDRNLAVTPDGSRVVYVGGAGGSRLFVRAFDQPDAAPIAGVSTPRHPFISPDSQWIGFFDGRTLKKVPITGGPPTTIVHGSSMTTS